ncbi:Flagellar basal-body rod protein flgG [Candidatus Hydrogenisulfobacillus filiaventi]|uniref:Flagellar basal-body rod protein flgG n=1 Tax=Candidatus Hydrogenisulfobacillus filiaventi TaxID=2707344 RepID=A0A6F8ZEK1_9FIRM|nr:flagellar hook basal-body protein [Bacillota bacterium]CAB1128029.1 Flagellar basal-body rod protein flgG [Candidatus Hydrogenisulfobacillus filiaventi]
MDALYTAAAGLKAQTANLNLAAADLADRASLGYLAAVPEDIAYPVVTIVRAGRQPAVVGTAVATGVAAATRYSLAPSAVESTGVATDLAVSGPGFFAVRTPQGVAWTRDGRFHRTPAGWLADAQGYPVLTTAGTPLVVGQAPFTVSADGTVEAGGQILGRLALADLAPQGLTSLGQGLYRGTPLPFTGEVLQGAVDGSNVPVTATISRLLSAQAAYQALAGLVNEESQRLGEAAGLAVLP